MNTIQIPLSKRRIILLITLSVLFVIVSLWLFLTADQQTYYNSIFVKIAGIVGTIFFGFTTVIYITKLFDKQAGLIIDDMGIIDNSSVSTVGLIEWKDIETIRQVNIMSTKILLIDVSLPAKYLNRVSGLKRKTMESNMALCGTPLSITPRNLNCKSNELEKLLISELEKRKKKDSCL
ncbi:STM3941 family protein [Dysgonomonas sp. 520]|uniref:STM3941 family protein n=1 Tax=Dysgonomonas sp. 520 TaxID=2302931 RepID=UPI0013D040EA|nr:STM3941 family protein [Dysgonomonas sp. 520]NDW09755.1 hypothetical protein [Dysgonomonas sp. 520]